MGLTCRQGIITKVFNKALKTYEDYLAELDKEREVSESIFPTNIYEHHENGAGVAYSYPAKDKGQQGLTKRDLFAAMAMQGCLASKFRGSYEDFAKASVKVADALIAELHKESEK